MNGGEMVLAVADRQSHVVVGVLALVERDELVPWRVSDGVDDAGVLDAGADDVFIDQSIASLQEPVVGLAEPRVDMSGADRKSRAENDRLPPQKLVHGAFSVLPGRRNANVAGYPTATPWVVR